MAYMEKEPERILPKSEARPGFPSIGSIQSKHNMSDTPEYKAWAGMHARCYNPHAVGYEYYGGRGIVVHPDFDDFPAFYRHLGPRPSAKHSLDRINTLGDYEPGNVRWATATEQANNTRRVRRIVPKEKTVDVPVKVSTLANTLKRIIDGGVPKQWIPTEPVWPFANERYTYMSELAATVNISLPEMRRCWVYTVHRDGKQVPGGPRKDRCKLLFRVTYGHWPEDRLFHVCGAGRLGCVNPFHLVPVNDSEYDELKGMGDNYKLRQLLLQDQYKEIA